MPDPEYLARYQDRKRGSEERLPTADEVRGILGPVTTCEHDCYDPEHSCPQCLGAEVERLRQQRNDALDEVERMRNLAHAGASEQARRAEAAEARISQLEEALEPLIEAVEPYHAKAAPHEDLWDAEDYRNFERLSSRLARARAALSPGENG